MSKFTTELRYICETYAGYSKSKGYANVDEIVTLAAPHVFDFSFPFYSNDSDKLLLEKKILKHFYTREICCETVGRWKLFLEDRLNTIMPYYNQLYTSAKLQFDPLKDTNYTVNHDGDIISHGTTVGKGTSSNNETIVGHETSDNNGTVLANETSDTNGTHNSTDGGKDVKNWNHVDKYSEWNLFSDTPQGGIAGIQGAEDDPSLGDNAYLTDARRVIHDGTGTNGTDTTTYGRTNNTTTTEHEAKTNNTATTAHSETTNNSTTTMQGETTNNVTTDSATDNTYLESIEGKRNSMSYSKMLQEYRETMLNIDKMVMDELNDLFFTLWE